jgi:two-component system cell cycle sensor histidine kinase/response regulator CckA
MPVKQTILIVEDEPAIRNLLAMNLEASYDVLVACDGIEAVQVYERKAERIVAIITDLDMPRLGGQLLTEWVHHISPQLPVIIMSGGITNADLEGLLRNPVVTFLSKPFEPSRLQSLLGSVLDGNRSEPPKRMSSLSLNGRRS